MIEQGDADTLLKAYSKIVLQETAERMDRQLIADYLEFERLWTDGVCR